MGRVELDEDGNVIATHKVRGRQRSRLCSSSDHTETRTAFVHGGVTDLCFLRPRGPPKILTRVCWSVRTTKCHSLFVTKKCDHMVDQHRTNEIATHKVKELVEEKTTVSESHRHHHMDDLRQPEQTTNVGTSEQGPVLIYYNLLEEGRVVLLGKSGGTYIP